MRHALAVALSFGILAGVTAPVAHAQTMTWVSVLGSDANPCSRTSPCRSFAGAIAKTAAGGEISVLDAGSYGQIDILKSLTINGGGGFVADVSVSGTYGVFVSVGNNDVVILRNLDINGTGIGTNGVQFWNGRQLVIENTRIFGFTRNGVEVVSQTTGAAAQLVIRNSTISKIRAAGPGLGNGIRVSSGNTMVSNSLITDNDGVGLLAEHTGVINADGNVLTGNGIGVEAGNGGPSQGAATVRLSNNNIYRNYTGIGCGGGVVASNGTNRLGSNTGGAASTCVPNAPITMQ